jgi:hypothetical protein
MSRAELIEAAARAMLKPWVHRDFNEQELAGARKDATAALDAILAGLKEIPLAEFESRGISFQTKERVLQAMLATIEKE